MVSVIKGGLVIQARKTGGHFPFQDIYILTKRKKKVSAKKRREMNKLLNISMLIMDDPGWLNIGGMCM